MQNILNQIVDSRISNFLEIINNNYPNKFKKENIEKEIIYIKQHILWEHKNFKQIHDIMFNTSQEILCILHTK